MLPFVTAVFLLACSGGTSTPEPTERPTPEATPTPWELAVRGTTYTKQASVGDSIFVDVEILNTGTKANTGTDLNFSELDKYADFFSCQPECKMHDLPGLGPSAAFRGIPAGQTVIFHVEFIAKTVGAVQWNLCVYDALEFGDQVWCGDATTAIR